MLLERTHQLNVGGNTDFLNMLERERLESKKISKTNAVTSQLDYDIGADNVHIGPSDHVAWLSDRKWAYIRLEGRSFGDVPLNVELKLEVWDSPNSAGIVIDAVRLIEARARQRHRRRARVAVRLPHEVAAMTSTRTTRRATRSRSSSAATRAPPRRRLPRRSPQGRRTERADVRIAHVSPYDPDEPGVVQDHVRAVSGWLAAQGHEVVVAAPSADRAVLREGRRRLAALAAGDPDALAGTPGQPLALALGPALPLRGRAAIAVPAAAAAGAGLLAAHGGLDIVHVHEPGLPVTPYRRARQGRALCVASFHTALPVALGPARGRDRRFGFADALVAGSPAVLEALDARTARAAGT